MFFTQRPQRAQSFIPLCVSRLRWRVVNFVTTRARREFYPPPPPCGGLAPVSGGERTPSIPLQGEESATTDLCPHHTNCPPETGGTRSEATEGVDDFSFSLSSSFPPSHLSLVGTQRAASALLIVLGRCTQRPYCWVLTFPLTAHPLHAHRFPFSPFTFHIPFPPQIVLPRTGPRVPGSFASGLGRTKVRPREAPKHPTGI